VGCSCGSDCQCGPFCACVAENIRDAVTLCDPELGGRRGYEAVLAVIKTLKSKLHIAKEESSSSSVALSTLTRNYREEKEGLMNRVAQLGSQCARLSERDEAYQAKVRRLEGDYER